MIAQTSNQLVTTTQKTEPDDDERWPIPHAAMFIFASASLCWITLFAVARAFFV